MGFICILGDTDREWNRNEDMVGKHMLAVIFSIVLVGNWLLMYIGNQ